MDEMLVGSKEDGTQYIVISYLYKARDFPNGETLVELMKNETYRTFTICAKEFVEKFNLTDKIKKDLKWFLNED